MNSIILQRVKDPKKTVSNYPGLCFDLGVRYLRFQPHTFSDSHEIWIQSTRYIEGATYM